MKKGHPEIVLFEPEIPQNSGNIGRLCAATASRLHMVPPFGFDTSDKNLRRSGLDYWPYLDLEVANDFDALLSRSNGRFVFLSKFGTAPYCQIPTDTQLLIFGRETSGLPIEFMERYPDKFYQIPMFHPSVRSLNLANAVSIVLYDQLAQRGLIQTPPRTNDDHHSQGTLS